MHDNLNQRLIFGDEAAFEELFKQFYFSMRAYAYRFVQSPAVAEDVVQDVFSQLWADREEIGKIRSLKSYLFTSVHNQASNYLKRRSVENRYLQQSLSEYEAVDGAYLPADAEVDNMQSPELSDTIKKLVRTLPDQTRRIFLLSRQYHLKNKDIAEFLDINIKTVEKHITKALHFLRDELGQYLHVLILVMIRFFY